MIRVKTARRLVLAVLLGLGSASAAMAAEYWHTATVYGVYVQPDGSFVVILDSDASLCPSTVTPRKHYTVSAGNSGVSAEGQKAMYAAALMAEAADKAVTILFSDSTTSCYISRMQVTGS